MHCIEHSNKIRLPSQGVALIYRSMTRSLRLLRGGIDLQSHRLTIGTDCSGMEAPLQALANMKIPHDRSFSCDFDPRVQTTINANFAPRKIYTDLLQRDNAKAPAVDVYIAGFPCQPFGVAGKQQGFEDVEGRSIIF